MRLRLLSCFLVLTACSGSSAGTSGAGAAAAGTCGSGDALLAQGIDPNGTDLAVSGQYVYYRHEGGSSTVLSRVPLAGGDAETISDSAAHAFAVNAAGAVAWGSPGASGQPELITLRDAAGATQTFSLPDKVVNALSLAIDSAGNVFALTDVAIQGFGTGQAVWRWSAERKAFDQLHKEIGGISGFFADGDGVAWIGPTTSGDTSLFHEDATGGAPAIGPKVPADAQVIGLDASKIYFVSSTALIQSIDRTTGDVTTEIDVPTPRPGSSTDFTVDDSSFYWVAHDPVASDATIWRAPKSGGAPETFATADNLGAPRVGGCSVAFLSVDGHGNWGISARAR